MDAGKKTKAMVLMSGGLDSQLAACLLREQGVEVLGAVFSSPLFDAEPAKQAGISLDISIEEFDFTARLVDVFERSGKLDELSSTLPLECHAEMIKAALASLHEFECDFLATGEVLNQRSLTQSEEAFSYVEDYVDDGDRILRPLSGQHLPATLPEREGWVQRDQLGAIEGSQRKDQRDWATRFGIEPVPEPSGTCRLADPHFTVRLQDLRAHEGLRGIGRHALRLLTLGRHFRLGPVTKLVVGRNEEENMELEGNAELYDLVLKLDEIPGPTGLLPIIATDDQIQLAAAICARYSDVATDGTAPVRVRSSRESRNLEVGPVGEEQLALLRI